MASKPVREVIVDPETDAIIRRNTYEVLREFVGSISPEKIFQEKQKAKAKKTRTKKPR